MKFFFLVIAFFILLAYCKAQNENTSSTTKTNENATKKVSIKKSKETLIKEITRKIDLMAIRAIKKTKTAEERKNVMRALKQKLIDTAKKKQQKLGLDDKSLKKYVDIILRSIDLIKVNRRSGSNDEKVTFSSYSNEKAQVNKTKDLKNISIHTNMERLKEKLIKEITAKVDKISGKAMEQVKNKEDIYSVLNKIKERLLSSARRRQQALKLNTNNLNSYVDIILKSVEYNLRANTNLPRRRIYDVQPDIKQVNETTNSSTLSPHKLPKDEEMFCEDVEKEICEDTKFIIKATCSYDDTELHINKICDGFVDCPDASDETNCSQQILKFIHKTNKILKALVTHISHQCLEGHDESEMTSQSKSLNDVLNTQVAIIKSHAVLGDSALRYDKDVIKLKHASLTNDVASVILMTTNAINSVLCKDQHDIKNIAVLTRRMSEALDENLQRTLDKIAQTSSKTCDCLKQNCLKDNCPERCKSVCKNKYMLDRWLCSDEVTSVPLDLVCDGKTDCFDESDEFGCDTRNSMTKIENDRYYDDILSLISLKTSSDDYFHVHNNINILANLVKKLREVTMRHTLHPSTIKIVRNETFDLLKSIYNESLKELTSDEHISRIYNFLRNISTKLLLVLKNSHTGNEKTASKELCWCQETRCIMPNCSRPCQRACAMERRIMNHTCSQNQNISINLLQVCDGRSDCPLRDDEDGCKQEICQRRHLLTLSNIIKPMGDDVKSPSLSAIIQNWGREAIEKIKQAEKNLNGKPTRPIIRRLLERILMDLVMSYAAVVVTRRNNFDVVKKEYDKVATTIKNFYKTCEH